MMGWDGTCWALDDNIGHEGRWWVWWVCEVVLVCTYACG